MSRSDTPLRLRDDPRHQRLFSGAGGVRPLSTRDREELYWGLSARLTQPRPALVPLGTLAAAMTLAVAGLWQWRHRPLRPDPVTPLVVTARMAPATPAAPAAPLGEMPQRRLDLGDVGALTLSAQADVELPAHAPAGKPYVLKLRQGRMCAEIRHRDLAHEGPVIVDAPSLTVTVIGTKFCVETEGGQSLLSVSQGRVRASRNGGLTTFVAAGDSIHSELLPLPAATVSLGELTSPAPRSPVGLRAASAARSPSFSLESLSCADAPTLDGREDCYAAAIGGEGFAAQEALFSLAVIARDQRHDGKRALADFRAYLSRFPQGAYAPEAAEDALRELTAEGRSREALGAADDYLRQYATQPRADEVSLVRARLLRDELGRPQEALQAYRQLVGERLSAADADEALFALGVCQLELGQTEDARHTFERYHNERPGGAHAADVARILGITE